VAKSRSTATAACRHKMPITVNFQKTQKTPHYSDHVLTVTSQFGNSNTELAIPPGWSNSSVAAGYEKVRFLVAKVVKIIGLSG